MYLKDTVLRDRFTEGVLACLKLAFILSFTVHCKTLPSHRDPLYDILDSHPIATRSVPFFEDFLVG